MFNYLHGNICFNRGFLIYLPALIAVGGIAVYIIIKLMRAL